MNDPELKPRTAEAAPKLPARAQRLHPRRVFGRLQREITGRQGQDYISKASRSLVSQGFIKELLTVTELFAITDIHVHHGLGISLRELRTLLPDYELLGQRSYGFFGELPYGLPKRFRVSTTNWSPPGRSTNFTSVRLGWSVPEKIDEAPCAVHEAYSCRLGGATIRVDAENLKYNK